MEPIYEFKETPDGNKILTITKKMATIAVVEGTTIMDLTHIKNELHKKKLYRKNVTHVLFYEDSKVGILLLESTDFINALNKSERDDHIGDIHGAIDETLEASGKPYNIMWFCEEPVFTKNEESHVHLVDHDLIMGEPGELKIVTTPTENMPNIVVTVKMDGAPENGCSK
jgi:hypothetical protein